MGTLRRFNTVEKQQKVIAMYKSGISIENIAKYFDCCEDTVSTLLHRLHIIVHSYNTRLMNIADKDKIFELYESGLGIKSISDICGCSYSTVYSIIHANKTIKIHPKQERIQVDNQKILKLYNLGYTFKEIENETGYSEWCIGRSLREQGIDTKERYRNHNKGAYHIYKDAVRKETELQYRLHKNIVNPKNLPRGRLQYHIDHIFSVKEGFVKNVPIKIISHYTNLGFFPYKCL